MEFKIDNNVKQEYLNTKYSSTAESEAFVLRYIDDYEEIVNKSVYNLTHEELNEMFSNFRNSSEASAEKNKSIIISYIDYCISKKLVVHMENRAIYIDSKKYVSKQAMKKYVDRKQLREYQNILYNEQDQLLIWLPFISVRGRTTKGCTFEEIINLNVDDIDRDKHRLTLRKNNGETRDLDDVDEFIFDLIDGAWRQEVYVENNGDTTDNLRLKCKPREAIINRDGEFAKYIFKIPGKNKFKLISRTLLNSRMRKYQEIFDNKYLTWNSLYDSGMFQMAMDIINEKGEITDTDFKEICVIFDYGIKEGINPDEKVSDYWYFLKKKFNKYRKSLL